MRSVSIPEFIQAIGSGRVVNALDLPHTDESAPGSDFDEKIALQEIAWRTTERTRPSQQQWYLASSGSAYSDRHFDSDGLATTVQVLRGMKIWILAYLKDEHGMAHINPFRNLQDGEIDPNFLELVPIVLRPGMTLSVLSFLFNCLPPHLLYSVMAPCTIHLVATTQPTFVWGRQFYAASSLRETCYGVFHCFTSGRKVTNVTHAEQAHDWLRVILHLVYYSLNSRLPQRAPLRSSIYRHLIPDRNTHEGVLDILHLCTVLFLGSAVFSEAYREDRPLPRKVCDNMMQGRQLALLVGHRVIASQRYWNDKREAIENPLVDVFWTFIAEQVVSIHEALKDKTLEPEVSTTTAARFKQKIQTLCGEHILFKRAYQKACAEPPAGRYGWRRAPMTISPALFSAGEPQQYIPPYPGHQGFSALEWYEGSSFTRS
ncbi:hypothetical protein NP233_g11780 [Leucocoprinus birnbaumii]|uniref:Uncharacterized protein n=1 Tax=Leucocoprinus birnbaumii TaxID=56174 RepID=A0AAD5VFR4_9AGAR|nr:hypothetical protein NP233_g11780 [Leucocoprinus birnbaumii]